jgi:2-oxoglutarate ferredoxin oxidoreductase subunit alpha
VIAVRNSQDSFDLMPVSYNLAEQYQTGVIVLTEKQIAEALYTQAPYDLKKATLHDRGLVSHAVLKGLKSADRYNSSADDGISQRWLPGSEGATYCAQSDEHDGMGNVDESGGNRKSQMEKRMRKLDKLKAHLPDPVLTLGGRPEVIAATTDDIDALDLDLLIVGWGSSSDVIEDVMRSEELQKYRVASLHYSYLWPLRTEVLRRLEKHSKRIVLVEQNFQGQLGMLIRMECGMDITEKILKYDGRPFFYDELLSLLLDKCGDPTGRESPAASSLKTGADRRLETSEEDAHHEH